jgi:hypothetical protein
MNFYFCLVCKAETRYLCICEKTVSIKLYKNVTLSKKIS